MVPREPGVEPGFVAVTVRPGFGEAGGEGVWTVAPPRTGIGFAAPPILFCGVLAPPNVLWAKLESEIAKPSAAKRSMAGIVLIVMVVKPSCAPRKLRENPSTLYSGPGPVYSRLRDAESERAKSEGSLIWLCKIYAVEKIRRCADRPS